MIASCRRFCDVLWWAELRVRIVQASKEQEKKLLLGVSYRQEAIIAHSHWPRLLWPASESQTVDRAGQPFITAAAAAAAALAPPVQFWIFQIGICSCLLNAFCCIIRLRHSWKLLPTATGFLFPFFLLYFLLLRIFLLQLRLLCCIHSFIAYASNFVGQFRAALDTDKARPQLGDVDTRIIHIHSHLLMSKGIRYLFGLIFIYFYCCQK